MRYVARAVLVGKGETGEEVLSFEAGRICGVWNEE
jgi:hypothetical protein